MQHTPGPWILLDQKLRPQFPARVLEVQDVNGNSIVKWPGFDGLVQPKKVIKANARLISSAPDLLEVLEDMLAWWEHPKEMAEIEKIMEKVERVLAKAGGKS